MPDQVRRFLSADDFLSRREAGVRTAPERGRRAGGRRVARQHEADDLEAIRRDFDGPRTIAFLNPKGGAAKTTSVLAAAATFGTVRGGGVIAWDNNEEQGTLGIRGARVVGHGPDRDVHDLLAAIARSGDPGQLEIGEISQVVRTQGADCFDLLAAEARSDGPREVTASDFQALHRLLTRFYRLVLIDTGNTMNAENWVAASSAADLLVVTTPVSEDAGYTALRMLDALAASGRANLKYQTVTLLSDPASRVDGALADDLVEVFQQRTRGVVRIPFDPTLATGSTMVPQTLSRGTRRAWISACAVMAAGL